MALVNDLHHMTFLTADLDRLIAFYERIFGARVTFDREEGVRHAFIEIGPHTVLLSFSFHDPDGGWHEVMWVKPGVSPEEGFTGPGDWKMIELD